MDSCRLHRRGDDIVLTRTIDDAPFHEHCADMRRELGDGMIRDAKGVALGRHLFSIPVDEAMMLLELHDADFEEWWNTKSKGAMARLIARYPHWVVAEGGGVL